MQPTFEQARQTVESLSVQDYERLFQWMRKKHVDGLLVETLPSPDELLPRAEEWPERAAKHRQAMKWIDEHRAEFLGQWVCLDGDNLISYGADALKVHAEAKAKGIQIPFLEHVIEEPEAYLGGWEACQ